MERISKNSALGEGKSSNKNCLKLFFINTIFLLYLSWDLGTLGSGNKTKWQRPARNIQCIDLVSESIISAVKALLFCPLYNLLQATRYLLTKSSLSPSDDLYDSLWSSHQQHNYSSLLVRLVIMINSLHRQHRIQSYLPISRTESITQQPAVKFL